MNGCACIDISPDEYEHADWMVTKKTEVGSCPIKCDECGRVLEEDTGIEVTVACWPDNVHFKKHGYHKPEIFIACEGCVELREQFFCFGWFFGMVIEDIITAIHEGYADGPCCFDGLGKEAVAVLDECVFPELMDDDDDEE